MTEKQTTIDPRDMKTHREQHANTRVEGGTRQEFIGANCECRRKTKNVKRKCIRCNGVEGGQVLKRIRMPEVGEKVNIRSIDLLTELFGDNTPTEPGEVLNILNPDEHHYEFSCNGATGWAVFVGWGDDVSWAFDLLEVELA